MVTDGEPVLGVLALVHVGIHASANFFFILDPIVLNGVRNAAEDVVGIFQPFGEHPVNLLVLGIAVNEVEHVDHFAGLAEPPDASEALFQSGGIPWQVNVDERAEGLKIQTFAGGVRGRY